MFSGMPICRKCKTICGRGYDNVVKVGDENYLHKECYDELISMLVTFRLALDKNDYETVVTLEKKLRKLTKDIKVYCDGRTTLGCKRKLILFDYELNQGLCNSCIKRLQEMYGDDDV